MKMAKITIFSALAALMLLSAKPAEAAILPGATVDGSLADIVGTNNDISNPTVPDDINAIITAYNAVRSPDLPLIGPTGGGIGKWEGGGFIDGVLSADLFCFYEIDPDLDPPFPTNNTVDIGTVFHPDNLVLVDPLDLNDPERNIIAFEFKGTNQNAFQYYGSKNSTQFTLWRYLPNAINPIYVEQTPGDNLFNPLNNAVSHFEFFNIVEEAPPVPEPASALLFAVGAVAVGGVRFARRRRSPKASETA